MTTDGTTVSASGRHPTDREAEPEATSGPEAVVSPTVDFLLVFALMAVVALLSVAFLVP